MSSLAGHLKRLIAANGPIPVSRYMAEALGHPEHGYYARRDPLGADGDFTTAPEISQMFGELIGLWCVEFWQRLGRPASLGLVELGPGRGTLMADALRAARLEPAFLDAVSVHLVETSPALEALQRERLEGLGACWHRSLETVPEGCLLALANEFFDALPVRQFERGEQGWHERLVANGGEALGFVLSPTCLAESLLPEAFAGATVGSVVEVAPSRAATMAALAGRIAAHGGAALVIDYGHADSAPGDTLQAVKQHAFHDVLSGPGEADLTAHVDFQALAEAARAAGAEAHGPVPQGDFLTALGIDLRAARLAAARPERAAEIERARSRLVAVDEMGRLFKALAVTAEGFGPPAGFRS
ncbi:MAG: SAM-dependent methyltransferase [Alphaproteobacteria bacterium]|jgi:NADH dehydrogenase [ubiquinone] 1 alpha subcomplex assembly factor 7|nr:SAM-dependent methyltransferase [Alphaproteobacteria bacterium]